VNRWVAVAAVLGFAAGYLLGQGRGVPRSRLDRYGFVLIEATGLTGCSNGPDRVFLVA
jgi:hypothetical protein